MATPVQRRELASRWFSMEHVASAFAKISDSEFETDCRKFLNLVNGMQGDRRRVYSYPCLEVYLEKHELLMPADEKLEEFWIDFNLGSHSISFYFSLAEGDGEEGQWDTICINENELQSYTVKEEGKRKLLQLNLSEVVMVGGVEGSSLTIHFSSSLDILQAARSIYGQTKNTGFVGKTGTSVVKTTVKIIMEENSSQQILTPANMRISESTTFICNSAGGSVHSAGSLSAVMQNTLSKGKGNPSLLRVRSCDRQGEFFLRDLKTGSHHTTPSSTTAGGNVQQSVATKKVDNNNVDKQKKNTPLEKAVDKVQTGQREEQSLEDNYVPDTQPTRVKQISSNWGRLSVSEMLTMSTQKVKTLQRPEPQSSLSHQQQRSSVALRLSVPDSGPICQKQLHTKLTQRLQKVLMQQTQRSGSGKVKTKGQMSLEADAAPHKAPVKAPNTTSLQERVTPDITAETNRALSSKEKEKKHVKKHLFSDTDTDHAMTEVSWLRESSRKPKPKVTKYSRQAPIKPRAESPQTSCESSHLPPPSPKPVKGNTKPNNQKKHNVKERVEQPKKMVKPAAEAPNRPHAAGRRPRRAAATSTKSYREPDTDDSQSDYCASDHLENTEKTHDAAQVMKKKSATKQPAEGSLKLHSSHLSSRLDIKSDQPSIFKLFEHLCLFWTLTAYERSAPTLDLTFSPLVTPRGSPLPASPDPACQDTPSPILRIPKPCSTVSSNGNFKPPSHYSGEKKRSTSRTQSIQSAASLASLRHQNAAPNPPVGPHAAKNSPNQQCLSPAPQSPSPVFTQPLLTSTFFELDKPSLPSPPQSPFPEDNNNNLYGIRPSRKRHVSKSSNSEEDEKEEKMKSKMRAQHAPQMKPRKLFKSCKTCYL
ncbi:unnamed protein product [Pleuronectes platessa]|uniref:Synaptonemal complex protein 2 Spt16M-like domain-containing protein n=1 Tax=Pleuronectes platessa TaxID=8262 RepID=A0A9N7V4Z4_PLEPL|nr:unnamed protein product [Pleuronectes platessa]